MARITGKSVLKVVWVQKKREVGVTVDGQDRDGWKIEESQRIGNVVSNTWKLHWISEASEHQEQLLQ